METQLRGDLLIVVKETIKESSELQVCKFGHKRHSKGLQKPITNHEHVKTPKLCVVPNNFSSIKSIFEGNLILCVKVRDKNLHPNGQLRVRVTTMFPRLHKSR